jgi:AraC-like DNA-binding protein
MMNEGGSRCTARGVAVASRLMNGSSIVGPMRVETARGVSPLGAWTYSAWRPSHLGGLVDHVWAYEGPSAHRRKRVFPNGRVELLLNFGEPYRIVEGEGTESRSSAWINGLQAGPLVVQQPAHQHVLGVRLRPFGARAIVERPMHEVTGRAVDLADLVGPAAGELVERCTVASSVADRFRIVADWIGRRFLRAYDPDEAVAWAVEQLDASRGTVPIAALRERTGLSKTRLVQAFRDEVGLAPKLYGRVVRFHQTLRLLQRAAVGRLTDVALDARFYDHPHMNAEFRALGGLSPREFLTLRHPVGDGSTAADGPAAA